MMPGTTNSCKKAPAEGGVTGGKPWSGGSGVEGVMPELLVCIKVPLPPREGETRGLRQLCQRILSNRRREDKRGASALATPCCSCYFGVISPRPSGGGG